MGAQTLLLVLSFIEHLYPTGDCIWSDDALDPYFIEQFQRVVDRCAIQPKAILL